MQSDSDVLFSDMTPLEITVHPQVQEIVDSFFRATPTDPERVVEEKPLMDVDKESQEYKDAPVPEGLKHADS